MDVDLTYDHMVVTFMAICVIPGINAVITL